MSYLATVAALALWATPGTPGDVPASPAEAKPASGADELAQAIAALEVPDFALARSALDRALECPGNDRQTLLQIFELRGFVAASLRDTDAALEAFKTLLVLAPEYQRTRSYSPRVMTPFLEARAWLSDNGALRFVPLPPSPEKGVVKKVGATVVSDPLKLARKVRFYVRPGRNQWQEEIVPLEHGMAEVRLRIPGTGWWAELLGERDAVLSRIGSAEAPILEGDLSAQVSPLPRLSGRQWTGVALGGAAAIALGTATAFGLSAQSQRDQIATAQRDSQGRIIGMTQRRAYEIGQEAQTSALLADVFWVGAALLAGGSGAMFWLDAHGGGIAVGGKLP